MSFTKPPAQATANLNFQENVNLQQSLHQQTAHQQSLQQQVVVHNCGGSRQR